MNVIRMTGGLGNQMFSFALYMKFRSMGIDCMMDDFSEYEGHDNRRPLFLKDAFGIDYPRVPLKIYNEITDSSMRPDKRLLRLIRGRRSREYRESSLEFDPVILDRENSYLTGYFQSEKYFADIKDEVRNTFSFTEKANVMADSLASDNGLSTEMKKTVAVHIRRGDYLNAADVYGGICTEEYYRSAIRLICEKTEDPEFIFFSNDPEWTLKWSREILTKVAEEKIADQEIKYRVITGSEESTGYADMCLMSRCTHFIIANSSFSWWGAYLGQSEDSIVIAPSKWQNAVDRNDIYTVKMIRIPG